MRSRSNPAALAKITSIRTAQRAEAQQTLARADLAERRAREEVRVAEAGLEAAVVEWRDHIAGPAFLPELAQSLGNQLLRRVEAIGQAQANALDAAENRGACQAEWHASDVRLRQARDLLDDSRRAERQRRDERALDTLADRTSFAWSRA